MSVKKFYMDNQSEIMIYMTFKIIMIKVNILMI